MAMMRIQNHQPYAMLLRIRLPLVRKSMASLTPDSNPIPLSLSSFTLAHPLPVPNVLVTPTPSGPIVIPFFSTQAPDIPPPPGVLKTTM